jgi:hypothetical protein
VSSARRPTRIWRGLVSLVVLALLALTLHTVVFSGASFTAGSATPANIVVAGVLTHVNSQEGQVMISASNLVPGVSRSGTMTLTGTGTVDGVFTLSAASLINTPVSPRLSDVLTLTVDDLTGAPQNLYRGTISGLASVGLGTIAAGASHTYRLTLSYPAGANDAALQGATMTLGLNVTGVAP